MDPETVAAASEAPIAAGAWGASRLPKDALGELFLRVLEHAPHAVALLSADLHVVFLSRRSTELLGLPPDSGVGRPATLLVETEHRPALREALIRVRSGAPHERLELHTADPRHPGLRLQLAIELFPLHGPPPAPGVAVVIVDVTAARSADAQRIELERVQRSLLQLTVRFASAAQLDELAELVIGEALPLVGAVAGGLGLVDDGNLQLLSSYGLDPDIEALRRVPLCSSFPGAEAAREHRELWFAPERDGERARPRSDGAQGPKAVGVRGFVPLLMRERAVGVLALGFPGTEAVPERARALVREIAARAAVALERLRLQQRERAYTRRMEVLAELSAELLRSLDEPDGLDRLLAAATSHLGSWAVLEFVERDGSRNRRTHTSEPEQAGVVAELARFAPGDQSPMHRALSHGEAFLLPLTLRLDAIGFASTPRHAELLASLGPASVAVQPLWLRGRVRGALALFRSNPRPPFAPEDLPLVGELATRAGHALERAETHRETQEARDRAEALARTLERMIGIVSHDLKSPLAAALLTTESTLRRPDLPAPARASLERVRASAGRMRRLVDQLLDFARIRETGGMGLEPRTVELRDVVAEVVDEHRATAAGSPLRLQAPASLRAEVDPDRLAQAISNLVGNAVEHGRPGGPVSVRLGAEGDAVLLEVHNEGDPIPLERQDSLFEPFRSSAATSRGHLGIGLYVTREIATAHGGVVEVRSDGATGTTFRLRLPGRLR